MTRKADYCYRNAADTIRVRIFRKESGRWDFDVFRREPSVTVTTYSEDAGDDFRTLGSALAGARRYTASRLHVFNPAATVTEGWS